MEIVNLTVHRYTNLKINAFLDTLDQEKNHTMLPQLKHFLGFFMLEVYYNIYRGVWNVQQTMGTELFTR